MLFVFKIITKYFQYENFFLFRSNTNLQNWIKRTSQNEVVVNLFMKKNFTEPVVCKTNPLYTKKNKTYIVGKQYLDHEKDVFSDNIGVWGKSKTKSCNFGKWESEF